MGACGPITTASLNCQSTTPSISLSEELEETSGVAVSLSQPDIFWTHNDDGSVLTAIGSDGPVGIFGEGTPHPRQYGTFARVLGHYVRERAVLTLEDAVRKMSSQTARRLGIHNRGLLTEGYYADIAIFDSDEIIDKATFEEPHQYAIGIKFVLVNGQVVVEQGRHTGRRPGKIIYGPGYTGI